MKIDDRFWSVWLASTLGAEIWAWSHDGRTLTRFGKRVLGLAPRTRRGDYAPYLLVLAGVWVYTHFMEIRVRALLSRGRVPIELERAVVRTYLEELNR